MKDWSALPVRSTVLYKISKIRKIYFARLYGRIATLIAAVILLIRRKDLFSIITGWHFFDRFNVLHILWGVWMIDMLYQLLPIRGYVTIGSRKHFVKWFRQSAEKINYQALKEHVTATTRSAYKVFVLWVGLLAVLAVLYFTGVLTANGIFLFAVIFYVCDLICVLIWCPFRLIMGNRCCTTCRIFNWDHLMMFSPFVLIPGIYTTSLLLVAFGVWVLWEVCAMLYPERFWENSNEALQCANCTDKLCTQYCRKIRPAKPAHP